jgi:hypothetical protein
MSRSAKPTQSQEGAPRRGWPRQAAETALGEAGNVFARAGFTDVTLLLRWAEIASPQIARIARPMRWQDGPEGAILTLKCEAGAIVFLQHQTRELIERLNAYLGRGRIARLKLVTGQLAQGAEPPNHPAPLSEPPLSDTPGDKPALPQALARLAQARARLANSRANRPVKRAD